MEFNEALFDTSRLAGEDMSAAGMQYRCVKLDANRKWITCTVEGEAVQGILHNRPALNEAARVMIRDGRTILRLGGTVTAGAQVTTDDAGRAIVAGVYDEVLGSVEVAGAVDEAVEAFIRFTVAP